MLDFGRPGRGERLRLSPRRHSHRRDPQHSGSPWATPSVRSTKIAKTIPYFILNNFPNDFRKESSKTR
ncbi:hypothetical protein NDU88_004392 [Pleurodeles waltl]|uniref:Uncharacterized protein n=1 Tax=Pleurodeles waltl TaxID=8319 RepID=A0AAV7WUI3_PLEWA|nr:hypothetical protein NDU88_004392 [Pleurodeles waltl]